MRGRHPELLARIEAVEDAVEAMGFLVCRVRAHENGSIDRIEMRRMASSGD